MLRFHVHVKNDRPAPRSAGKGSAALPWDRPISEDNAGPRRRIPRLMLEFPSSMNPRLEQLIHLQRVESELKRTQAGLAEIPRRKAELEAELAAERARLDAARDSLDDSLEGPQAPRGRAPGPRGEALQVQGPAHGGQDQQGVHGHAPRDRGRGARDPRHRGPDPGRDGEGGDAHGRGQAGGGRLQGPRGAAPHGRARPGRAGAASWRATPPGWGRSGTRWPRRLDEDTLELFQRIAKLRGIRRGGSARRHVPGLPRQAAPSALLGPQAQRRDRAVPRLQPHPLLRAARPRHCSPNPDRPTLHIHIDGGSRGNPGDAGFGVYVTTPEGAVVAELYGYLGRASNNVAEYQALIHALRYALDRGAQRVKVFSDSELVVRQIGGQYRVKHPDMIPLHREAKALLSRFEEATRVPRAPRAEQGRRPPGQPGPGRESLEARVGVLLISGGALMPRQVGIRTAATSEMVGCDPP